MSSATATRCGRCSASWRRRAASRASTSRGCRPAPSPSSRDRTASTRARCSPYGRQPVLRLRGPRGGNGRDPADRPRCGAGARRAHQHQRPRAARGAGRLVAAGRAGRAGGDRGGRHRLSRRVHRRRDGGPGRRHGRVPPRAGAARDRRGDAADTARRAARQGARGARRLLRSRTARPPRRGGRRRTVGVALRTRGAPGAPRRSAHTARASPSTRGPCASPTRWGRPSAPSCSSAARTSAC